MWRTTFPNPACCDWGIIYLYPTINILIDSSTPRAAASYIGFTQINSLKCARGLCNPSHAPLQLFHFDVSEERSIAADTAGGDVSGDVTAA